MPAKKRKRQEKRKRGNTTIELLGRGLVDGTEKRQKRKLVHAEFNQALQKARDRIIERTHCAPQSAPIEELQREIQFGVQRIHRTALLNEEFIQVLQGSCSSCEHLRTAVLQGSSVVSPAAVKKQKENGKKKQADLPSNIAKIIVDVEGNVINKYAAPTLETLQQASERWETLQPLFGLIAALFSAICSLQSMGLAQGLGAIACVLVLVMWRGMIVQGAVWITELYGQTVQEYKTTKREKHAQVLEEDQSAPEQTEGRAQERLQEMRRGKLSKRPRSRSPLARSATQ
jgi:hypothetical protein